MNSKKHLLILVSSALLLAGCGTVGNITREIQDITDTISKGADALSGGSKQTGREVDTFTIWDMAPDALTDAQKKELDGIAKKIKARKGGHVTLIGHADNTGTSDVNNYVSIGRANLVADYLSSKGVSKDRISVFGESYNHPVAGNDTAAGRAKNRRVEIYVTSSGVYNPYR